MALDEKIISEAIIDKYFKKLKDSLEADVILVGGGPANLVGSYYMAKAGLKTVIFESKLAPGGGMWAGGIMFNEAVVQKEALEIFDDFGIKYTHYRDEYYTADSVNATATLISKTTEAGTTIFNLMKVTDVMFREENNQKFICGAVIQYSPIETLQLFVDPITVKSKAVVDGTGHPAEICSVVTDKLGIKIDTPTGGIPGEMSMFADIGEDTVVKNTKEVFPGLWVTGMAANAVMGTPRMGPIFGGMIRSGKFLAEQIIQKLKNE